MPKNFRFALFVSLSFGLLFLIAFGIFRYLSRPAWQTYKNEELGVKLDWPDNFQVIPLTGSEKESGMVFKIERKKPEAQVFLRYEDNLGPIRFTGKTILDYLVETIDRTYPKRFPDFYKEDQRRFVLAGQNAEEFVFTYKSPNADTRVRQRYVVVVKEETAYFLSCQAPVEMWSQAEPSCDIIKESFEFHF